MRLLAFDTLGPALSAAAVDAGDPATPVAERAEAVQRGQAERILPLVEAVLADAGWKYLSADFWSADDVETSMERTLWW